MADSLTQWLQISWIHWTNTCRTGSCFSCSLSTSPNSPAHRRWSICRVLEYVYSACSSERNSFHVSFTCDTPILMLIAYVSYVPSFVCWFYAEGCWRKHRKPCRAEPLKIIPTPQRPNASSSGDPVSAEPVTDEIPRRHYRANLVERLRSSGEWRPPPHRTWRIETKIKTQNPITPSQISRWGGSREKL